MPDVFSVLGEDHHKVLQTLDALTADTTLSTSKDGLVTQLVIDESKHEAIEEMYFWPIVKEKVAGGGVLAEQALQQEEAAKPMLEELERCTGAARDRLIRTVAAAAREHIAFEQDRVWTKLRPVLSAKEAEELGDRLQQAKRTAPTRPHSHTPASPGVLKAVGPAAGAMDRVRDAVTGRG